jgi:hypothetical protein
VTERTDWVESGNTPMTRKQQKLLNAERLRKQVSYDPETGEFRWRLSGRGRFKRSGEVAGRLNERGYIRLSVDGNECYGHRLAWLYMTGEWPENEIDHINRVRSDNRFANLRAATTSENRRNTKGIPSRRIHSRFKGVSRERGRWVAKISTDGKTVRLGLFDTEEDAAGAYRLAAERHHGEFAKW